MFDALMTLRPDLVSVAQRPGAIGRVFYVKAAWLPGGGDDANSGHDPSAPLATIAEAMDRCTNDHNDYIIVLGCWEEPVPIVVDKTTVHIIGIGGSLMCPAAGFHAPTDEAVFLLTADSNNLEIAGFSFGGSISHGSIENVAGTVMGLNIHHCVFGHSFAADGDNLLHGIHIASNATGITIANCIFLGTGNDAGGLITGNGIYFNVSADTLGGLICNNLFVGIPGIGIQINSLGTGMMIVDNVFALDDNTAGAAITLSANVIGALIANNVANFGKTSMGLIPWVDGAANTWANNKRGGEITGITDQPWVMPA